jgi:hypothetical protein
LQAATFVVMDSREECLVVTIQDSIVFQIASLENSRLGSRAVRRKVK